MVRQADPTVHMCMCVYVKDVLDQLLAESTDYHSLRQDV